MDGLIVDSEPRWRRSEVEVFGEVGLALTEAMCEATTGLRIDEVALHWFRRAPWEGPSPHALAERIVDRMIEGADTAMQPGVERALETCAQAGLRLAVASSSPLRLIDATLSRLGLYERFELVVSAEHQRYGKPHPAVFLDTAERLGVAPTECLVLEDSLNGVLAAKAARTTCIAVPSPSDRADPRFVIADRVLESLEELDARGIAELAGGPPGAS
jgi:sugar-phosphatase